MKKIGYLIFPLLLLLVLCSCDIKFGANPNANNNNDDETKSYIVEYIENGGSAIDNKTFNYDAIPTNETTTKNGYTFNGWYLDEALENEFMFSYAINMDAKLYAKWSINTYTITYNLDGGVNNSENISSYTVEDSDFVLKAPTKEGYSFRGWYIEENRTMSFIDTASATNYVLTAGWTLDTPEIITYEIRYILDGGTNNSLNISSYTENDSNFTLLDPVKDGYTFNGWKDSNGNMVTVIDTSSAMNYLLTAQWVSNQPIVYTISFVTNNSQTVNAMTTDSNGKINYNQTLTKTNYTFGGWYLNSDLKGSSINLDSYVFTSNQTLYAKWIGSNASLATIIINGEELVVSSSTLEYFYEEDNITSVTTSVTKVLDSTIVTGTGTISIELGNTAVLTITTTAENGSTLTYTVNITSNVKESINELKSIVSLNESIYLTYEDTSLTNAKVEYKNSIDDTYTTLDSNLISLNQGVVTANILGLTGGNYDVRITKSNNELITSTNIEVTEIDRSGYAHFSTSVNAIGAYNEDGSLKSNADIIYVSNATKNTVTYKVGSKTYTGLVNILKNAKNFTNPVVIRVLDSIKTNQWKEKDVAPRLADGSNYTSAEIAEFGVNELETTYGENLVGLTNKVQVLGYKTFTYTTTATGFSTSSSSNTSTKETTYTRTKYADITDKKVFDDDSYFNMIDIEESNKGLTIEGVGTEAEFFQFGLTFKKCANIEVRNLTFTDYNEDACSFEGNGGSEDKYNGFFIYACTFNRGKNNWDISGERDKYAGDGATDLKKLSGVTIAYTVYNKCKKTGLVGGSDSDLTYNITFHHNYYNEVESRLPLGRQANLHMYNNYYYECNSTLDLRNHAYAFTEANYFENSACGKTRQDSNSAIKSFNDVYINCSDPTGSNDKYTAVTSREEVVTNSCTVSSVDYSSFDTNSTLFYYDSDAKVSNVKTLTSAEIAKETCVKYSGVLKPSYN